MTLAYSYLRFSSRQQAKGDSQRRQLDATRAYCERNGLTLADITLADLGVSAYRGRNASEGALARFLAMAEAGDIPVGSRLIVESLDRLSREEVMQALTVLQRIVATGFVLVTLIDGEREYSGSLRLEEIMWALMTMARAHDESVTKGTRSRANWSRKRRLAAEKGELLHPTLPAWLELVDGKATPNWKRVEVLREMYRLALEEGLGVRAIAKRLDSDGVKPWGPAKFWSSTTVHKYLTTRAVLGEFQPQAVAGDGSTLVNVGEPVVNYFPAVIDAGLFERVQAVRGPRSKAVPGPKNRPLLLSGLLRCGACGGGMAHYGERKIDIARYRCRRFCSGNRGWPAAAVDEWVLTALVNGALAPIVSADQTARLREVLAQLQECEGLQQSLSLKIQRLLAEVEEGRSAATSARLREREAELDEVTRRRAALTAERTSLQAKVARAPDSDVWKRLEDLQALRLKDPEGFTRRAAVHIREAVSAVRLLAPKGGTSWELTLLDHDGKQLGPSIDPIIAERLTVEDARYFGSSAAVTGHMDQLLEGVEVDPEDLLPDELQAPPKRARKRTASGAKAKPSKPAAKR
jgi:DNA invertase Pin-like site-specific DNA recombinase